MTVSIGPMWPCKAHLSHGKSNEFEPNYKIVGSVKYFFLIAKCNMYYSSSTVFVTYPFLYY